MELMLDLETMGIGPNAAIIAIGAVAFDLDRLELTGQEFYQTIDLESSVEHGGGITPSTVLWWMQQSDEARDEFKRPGGRIEEVLMYFHRWLPPTNCIQVWGNGANFDNVVLRTAYERLGLQAPWNFRNDRCFRTAKAMLPKVEIESTGVAHDALEDARWQARYLIEATRVDRWRIEREKGA